MPRVRIASHNLGKSSVHLARALEDLLGEKVRVWGNNSPGLRRGRLGFLINWGRSNVPSRWLDGGPAAPPVIINRPPAVARAQNKLEFLELIKTAGIRCPNYTRSQEVARDWAGAGLRVLCRTMLRASSGKGIVIANSPEEVVPAPLYTVYEKKKEEYRLHYFRHFDGTIRQVDCQQKRKRRDVEDADYQVRNHANGWIYARQEVTPPLAVTREALAAFDASALNFGAVDVIYNQHYDAAYVLEINTAPGLEGTTVDIYANNFIELMREKGGL